MASAASEEVLAELITVDVRDSFELTVQYASLKKRNFPFAITFCVKFILIPIHVTPKMDAEEVAFL